MKQIKIFLALMMLAVLASCNKDAIYDNSSRHIRINAYIPGVSDATRAVMNPKENSLDMLMNWGEKDYFHLIVEQDGQFFDVRTDEMFGYIIPISTISENRKSCTFEFDMPAGVDMTKDYKIFGCNNMEIVGIDAEEHACQFPDIMGAQIADSLYAPMYFIAEKGDNLDKIEFKHFTTYEILHITNTSNETISFHFEDDVFDVRERWFYLCYCIDLPGAKISGDDNFIGHFHSWLENFEIRPGDSKLFFSNYVPTGKKIRDARLNAVINGQKVSSSNTLSSDVELEIGKAYHMYATWNGQELKFGKKDIRETIIYPTSSYELSEDGKTLVKWLGDETEIDMSADPAFDHVIKIGNEAFVGSSLKSLTLSRAVEEMGSGAVSGSCYLNNLHIPPSLMKCNFEAFQNGVKNVYIEDLEAWCNIYFDDMTFADGSNPLSSGANLYVNNELVEDLVLPEGLTSTSSYAFRGWKGRSVTFPKSFKMVSHGSFMGSNIEDINFGNPDEPIYINNYAFSYCEKIKTVNLKGVGIVDGSAFTYCTALSTVNVGSSITYIGDSAFGNCRIKSYNVIEDSPLFSSYDGILLNADGSVLVSWPPFKEGANYVIPSSIKELSAWAFHGAVNLKSIILNGNIQEIKDYTFHSSSIINIDIPDNVKRIGSAAFFDCRNLASVTLPEGLERIEEGLFGRCKSLNSITIPSKVNYIGVNAFQDCEKLAIINFPDNKLVRISWEAFKGTAWLANQPDGAVYLGKILLTYKGATDSDETLWVKSGTLAIAEDACSMHKSLTYLILPESLLEIGRAAFYGCSNINHIKCFSQNPPTLGRQAFDIPLEKVTLSVPHESVEDYKKADGWKDFGTIVAFEGSEPIPDGTPIEGDNNGDGPIED